MSEIKKNIETCRGEDVLAEVSAAPQDPHFGSLVNEAFDPMQQQALRQAGYDGYSEVIEQHKPYTFASAIIQMKSNLLLLLRALWKFPFGSGTLRSLSDDASLRSLSDMWQHYITRLSGNETYGIPSRLSSLTDLPSAPLLLADRKISCNDSNVPDGISLAHLICTDYVAELIDDNSDWDYTKEMPNIFANLLLIDICPRSMNAQVQNLSSVKKLVIRGVKSITWTPSNYKNLINNMASLEELEFPDLEYVNLGALGTLFGSCPNLLKVTFPKLTTISCNNNGAVISNTLQELNMPSLTTILRYNEGVFPTQHSGTALAQVKLGKVVLQGRTGSMADFYENPNLQHLELGEGVDTNTNLSGWNPTDKGETFLSNFRTYIALRLADNGSGKTLTLSQAVRNAIHAAESTYGIENIIITQKGWTISPAPN